MTQAEFTAFYPQFAGFTPAVVLTEYLRQANARFSAFSPEDAEEARRLYTAHKLTLYSAACLPEGLSEPTRAQIAAAGRGSLQEVSSKKAGDVSVSYDTSSSVAGSVSTSLADLKQTVYGLQLLSLLSLYSRPEYIP